MNPNDPSLYAVTPREMTPYPFAWQSIPRFVTPFQTYGMQPFQSYGMQPFQTYGMQPFQSFGTQPFQSFGTQPFYPFGYGPSSFAPTAPAYGSQQFVPPTFAYGYNVPFQAPWMGGQFGLPCFGGMQGWQKPLWY